MVKLVDKIPILTRLEVALYSAGRPLSLDELIKASGSDSKLKVLEQLEILMRKTKSAFKGLEITRLPDRTYVFQVKAQYGTLVRKFASRPILPKATLKTLSYVAYMQPISSKQLVETRGGSVYSHLKDLFSLDYITYQNVGRIKIYTTTDRFQKYFGLDGDIANLKEQLFKKRRTS